MATVVTYDPDGKAWEVDVRTGAKVRRVPAEDRSAIRVKPVKQTVQREGKPQQPTRPTPSAAKLRETGSVNFDGYNPFARVGDESRWAGFWGGMNSFTSPERAITRARAAAEDRGDTATIEALDELGGIPRGPIGWLNEKKPTKVAAATPTENLLFPTSTTPATPAAASATGSDYRLPTKWGQPTDVLPDVQQIIGTTFPGTLITDAERTQAQQDAYFAAGKTPTRSGFHTQKKAIDLRPPKGVSQETFIAGLRARPELAGYDILASNDGAVHIEPGNGANPFAPALATAMNPAAAMGMVPMPARMPRFEMPERPALEAPPDITPLPMFDKVSALAEMKRVIEPLPPEQRRPWERFQMMLEGAASNLQNADPYLGTGGLIAAAGAGASRGNRVAREEARAEKRQYDEAKRAAAITMAQMGFQIDLSNYGVQSQNVTRADESKFRKVDWKNRVATQAFEDMLTEATTNYQAQVQDISNLNAARNTQAQVGIQALQGVIAAQNQNRQATRNAALEELQWTTGRNDRMEELGLKYGGSEGYVRRVQDLGSTAGILMEGKTEDPRQLNYRTAAMVLAAPAARERVVENLGVEAVYFFSEKPEVPVEIDRELKPEEKKAIMALKNDASPEKIAAAGAAFTALFKRKPALRQIVLQQMMMEGNPIATMIAKTQAGK